MVGRVVWYIENLQENTSFVSFDSCADCLYRFDASFFLSCSGEHMSVLWGGRDPRRSSFRPTCCAVVRAIAQAKVLQIVNSVQICLFNFVHKCVRNILLFSFMQVNFVVCQLFALLAAVWFRTYLHSSKTSPFIRHVVATLLGLYLALFCFGW